MTAKKSTKPLSDRALFALGSEFEASKKRAVKYETDVKVGWRSIQSKIVAELKRRKVKSLTDESKTTITLVAPESVVYGEDEIWEDLTPAKRKAVFDRTINLSALPKEVQADLLKHLTPTQRRRVVGHKLNVSKLAGAMQDGKISAEFIAERSEIKESSPYVRISRGSE